MKAHGFVVDCDCQPCRDAGRTQLRHVRRRAGALIHHTDRGDQYASARYREILCRANIRQSMSRDDNGYDNAVMESGFGTFKTELEMTEHDHQRATRREISHDIAYYNTLCPQLSLTSPV